MGRAAPAFASNRVGEHRGRPKDQELTQTFFTGATYPTQALLAATGMILWCQAQKRSKRSPRSEAGRIDSGCEGECGVRRQGSW